MALNLDHRYKKLDGDLLLTLACPNQCDFCIYSCTTSKEPQKWMPEETIRRVAKEYSKNNIGIRIGGGEPFYDPEKLERCLDILLEFYKPRELLIITSGFFGINKEKTKEYLNIIRKRFLDTLVVSSDRFHQKKVPLSNITNILEAAKEMDIKVIIRATFDSLSFSLIDSLSEMVVKYRTLMEVHNWHPIGRAERLDTSPLENFKRIEEYLFSKIKHLAKKYNAPPDPRYYLIQSPKRSQWELFRVFFPTTFPNGDVYGCSMTAKLGYLGNINREDLLDMTLKWKRTLPGFFVISRSQCGVLSNFLPEKFNHHCEFCKDQPFENNLPKEALGRGFVKVNMKMDLNDLIGELSKEDREYLLSFRLTEDDLNEEAGQKIKKFLDKLKLKGIRFILSRPLPRCLGNITDSNAPKNCWECRELFGVENGFIKYCPPLKNEEGYRLKQVKDRKQIFEYFEAEHNKLKLSEKCRPCSYRMSGQCNALCFRKEKIIEKVNSKPPLIKTPNFKKTVNFLLNAQKEDGSYPALKPNPVVSMYFLGILRELKEKPKFKKTSRWVSSLQTDRRGFGETTGENSWDYTTYWGSQMHQFLKLKPKFERDYINFIRFHQNPDGGFGATINVNSNLTSTFHWALSLIDMGYKLKDKNKLIDFLSFHLNHFRNLDLDSIYKIIYTLRNLNSEIMLKEEIEDFILKRHHSTIPLAQNIESLYYIFSILKLLNKKTIKPDPNFILKCKNIDGGFGPEPYSISEPAATYFSLKLLKMAKFSISKSFKNEIINYCYNHELQDGGFYDDREKGPHGAYCCLKGLKLLGREPKFKEKIIIWFKYCQNNDGGFGYAPNSPSNEKATYWTVDSLKSLDALDIIGKEKLIEFLNNNIKNINPYISYYLLGTCELLDIIPPKYDKIVEELLQFKNIDGGFGPVKNAPSQMYETFRAINAIYSIEKILDKNNIDHQSWLQNIKEDVIKWILGCEGEGGGFSWVPGKKTAYIQPTYHALTVLNILNKKIKNPEKHKEWILRFQNKDGGFNGGTKGTPSDVHFTFWALESLNILRSMIAN